MSATLLSVELRIRFLGAPLLQPIRLDRVLGAIDQALLESDRHDLRRFSAVLSPIVIDACFERLRKFNGQRIVITRAKSSSIELCGIVQDILVLIIWEALKALWRSSLPRWRQLKELIKDALKNKTARVIGELVNAFRQQGIQVNIYCLPSDKSGEAGAICIDVLEDSSDSRIPRPGELLRTILESEEELPIVLIPRGRPKTGDILMAFGSITREQLDWLLEKQKHTIPRQLIGDLAVKEGFCTTQDVEDAIRAQRVREEAPPGSEQGQTESKPR